MSLKINGSTSGSVTLDAPATGSDVSVTLPGTNGTLLNTPGAWTAWTPTTTGITVGNGAIVARYEQVGKTVRGAFQFTLGSTSAITGLISFTVPVTSFGSVGMFSGFFGDVGSNVYPAAIEMTSGIIYMYATNVAGTYASVTNPSATIPFTFGTNDTIRCAFEYEAA